MIKSAIRTISDRIEKVTNNMTNAIINKFAEYAFVALQEEHINRRYRQAKRKPGSNTIAMSYYRKQEGIRDPQKQTYREEYSFKKFIGLIRRGRKLKAAKTRKERNARILMRNKYQDKFDHGRKIDPYTQIIEPGEKVAIVDLFLHKPKYRPNILENQSREDIKVLYKALSTHSTKYSLLSNDYKNLKNKKEFLGIYNTLTWKEKLAYFDRQPKESLQSFYQDLVQYRYPSKGEQKQIKARLILAQPYAKIVESAEAEKETFYQAYLFLTTSDNLEIRDQIIEKYQSEVDKQKMVDAGILPKPSEIEKIK